MQKKYIIVCAVILAIIILGTFLIKYLVDMKNNSVESVNLHSVISGENNLNSELSQEEKIQQEEAIKKAEEIAKENSEKEKKEFIAKTVYKDTINNKLSELKHQETIKNRDYLIMSPNVENDKEDFKLYFNNDNFEDVQIIDEKLFNYLYCRKDGINYEIYACSPYVLYSSDDFVNKIEGTDIIYSNTINQGEYQKTTKVFIGYKNEDVSILLTISNFNNNEITENDILNSIKLFDFKFKEV